MTERELTARQDLGAKGPGWRRRLPDVVVKRAEASGQRGRQWLDSLDGKIADLQALWQIEVGEVLSGGTHGLAAGAAGVDGARYVLKMDIPEAPVAVKSVSIERNSFLCDVAYYTIHGSKAQGRF